MAEFILDARNAGRYARLKKPATAPNPGGYKRDIVMCKGNGTVANVVLTSHSALVMPEGKYADQKRARLRRKGCFPWGKCPVALAATGQLSQRHLCDENKGVRGCGYETRVTDGKVDKHGEPISDANPCPHAIAEMEARKDKHVAKELERKLAWQTEEQRNAIKQNDLQMQTNEMLAKFASAVAKVATGDKAQEADE